MNQKKVLKEYKQIFNEFLDNRLNYYFIKCYNVKLFNCNFSLKCT